MAGDKAKTKSGGSMKPDFATIGGLVVALGGIIGGLILEKGSIKDVSQFTAAIIVLGGTLGAVMINTPMSVLLGAVKKIKWVFFSASSQTQGVIEEIIALSTKARKTGIVSLESDLDAVSEPFLRKAMSLAVDGTDIQDLRKMMELDIVIEEQHTEAEAKVFEAAGGFAPTVGIIGAVMGLIQVMKHLENIEEVGKGIAVAFVATVYGVGVANILFLPAAGKIKARLHDASRLKEMMLDGVTAIAEGLNPKLVRTRLEAYVPHASGAGKKAAAGRRAPQGRPAPAET